MRRAAMMAALVAVLLALAPPGTVAPVVTGSASAAAAEPVPAPPSETEYRSPARLTILGVERDPRFGRAWLLARLSGEGHLRTSAAN